MSHVAVVGESPRVDVWALAGALVSPAMGDDEVRRAWDALPADVEVVVLTPAAAAWIGDDHPERLRVILP